MAGLLIPMGTLADKVGNRRILLIGLVVFGVASGLAAFAPTVQVLIGTRVLLATGGIYDHALRAWHYPPGFRGR